MSDFRILDLPGVSDSRGTLIVLQDQLPFAMRRVYWITKADGQIRGGHRHHLTRQALVAVAGSVTVYMCDGRHDARILLDHPSQCLIVEPEDWHTMEFDKQAVLLVVASEPYSRADYIDEPYEAPSARPQ